MCAYVYMLCFALSLGHTEKDFDRYAIVALVHRSACNWSSSELVWVLLGVQTKCIFGTVYVYMNMHVRSLLRCLSDTHKHTLR